jgi:glutamyl/glutaminyl-tRNA synthetase
VLDPTFLEDFKAFLPSRKAAVLFRLAPTPSGFLHAGNALNFGLNYTAARHCEDGRVLLRIDDLDNERTRPEYLQDIFDSLTWLGIHWDLGPRNPLDFEQHWSQMLRLDLYMDLLTRLRQKGLLFACQKSRKELMPFNGRYPAEFRHQGLDLDAPDVAWRIKTPENAPLPDFIVRRRDGIPAYQVASVADDLHFGVTHVIRGADLKASTWAQQFLAECAGLSTEFSRIQFLHHPLLLDNHGEKLSKSAGAASLKHAREMGAEPPFGDLFSAFR